MISTSARAGLSAIVALGFAAAAGAGLAAPGTDPSPPSRTVVYRDLDLSQPAGAQVMLTRIHGAAMAVCGPAPDMRDLERAKPYRTCVDDAEGRSVMSLGNASVISLYSGKAMPIRLAQGGRQR